jgi:hypothetical protein
VRATLRRPRATRGDLREEALGARTKGRVGTSEHGLDEAEKMDPVVENDVCLRETRASIRKANAPSPVDRDYRRYCRIHP